MKYVLITLLFFVNCAYADEPYMEFKLECDIQKNQAEIIPNWRYNKVVYGTNTKDCTLNSGRTIRVKMGENIFLPYGQNVIGGWLSIWIDKAHIFSKEPVFVGEEGLVTPRFIISDKGVTVCRYDDDGHYLVGREEKCQFLPNSSLNFIRDKIEYPQKGERKRPKAGEMVTMYAKDKKFCALDFNSSEHFEEIEEKPFVKYEYAGHYDALSIDMNNDGVDAKVLKLSARTHSHDGDVFFLYDKKLPDEKGKTLDYAKSATHIFPYHWFGESVKFTDKYVDFPNSWHKLINAKAPWWNQDDKPVFDLRYSYWKPLRYKGTTYFYVSQSQDLGNWHAVVRPEKNHTLTEMCIFYTADVHY